MDKMTPLSDIGKQTNSQKIGVLLSNLGTPDGTDYWSVRRYLAEFLSDRRVIEAPRLFWLFVLNTLILTTRPQRKGEDYATIWNRDRNESPLKTITRSQAEKLQQSIRDGLLGNSKSNVIVDWGMRYGNPSLKTATERLVARGCERILFVPLYPQYSAATSATACDKLFKVLASMRYQPALRVATPYYDQDTYIDAIAGSLAGRLLSSGFEPDVIVASFHGMPLSTYLAGDPYYVHCHRTADLIRTRLGLSQERLIVTFQSRFGRAEWLKPYTDETIKALAANGARRIAVVTPGFSADCLETIEEIGQENAKYFFDEGGDVFARIDCLNDSDRGMRVIEALVQRELSGWV
ncbi:ferrochelatase [Bradyrhizobium hipponense]|uniref:Ferrochelatase n=1 Tax=Bradyrhizobium hipponense TaxID=2605638 RepID=A0A5S4YHA2_9BRAD|nr:ferrochelatase [Bradyrhizobium hipponense]TYO63800.1 ferrochelatase [Bradyrhizobium hipponense]